MNIKCWFQSLCRKILKEIRKIPTWNIMGRIHWTMTNSPCSCRKGGIAARGRRCYPSLNYFYSNEHKKTKHKSKYGWLSANIGEFFRYYEFLVSEISRWSPFLSNFRKKWFFKSFLEKITFFGIRSETRHHERGFSIS